MWKLRARPSPVQLSSRMALSLVSLEGERRGRRGWGGDGSGQGEAPRAAVRTRAVPRGGAALGGFERRRDGRTQGGHRRPLAVRGTDFGGRRRELGDPGGGPVLGQVGDNGGRVPRWGTRSE